MSNPLLPTAPPPPPRELPLEHSAVLRDQVEARYGPQTPLGIAPRSGWRLAPWRVDAHPALWVVGAHGGAGATTLARLLGPAAQELARHLPVVPSGAPAPRVLLVARTHTSGLACAAGAAAQWASGTTGVTLVGLAVVDDAPKLPKQLVDEVARLGGMVPALWHLPWCEPWRTTAPDETPTELPRRTRKSLDAIKAAANKAKDAPPALTPATTVLRPPPTPAGQRTALWAPAPPAQGYRPMTTPTAWDVP